MRFAFDERRMLTRPPTLIVIEPSVYIEVVSDALDVRDDIRRQGPSILIIALLVIVFVRLLSGNN